MTIQKTCFSVNYIVFNCENIYIYSTAGLKLEQKKFKFVVFI